MVQLRLVKVTCRYCGGVMRYPTAARHMVFPRCIHCDRPFSVDLDRDERDRLVEVTR